MKTHSPILLAGAAALALAGLAPITALGSPPVHHELTVRLPGGGIERIEYTGETPKVVFAPAPFGWAWPAPVDFWAPPSYAGFERMSADMERRIDALFREQQNLLSSGSLLDDTKLTNLPPGTISTTWISTSSGNGVCTRETRISRTSAEGKPEVVSRQSGNCGANSSAGPSLGRSPEHDDATIEASFKTSGSNAMPATF